MEPKTFKSFDELPEEEKAGYRSLDDEGSFVKNTAIEDIESAHRLANLENEAFSELQTKVLECKMTVEEIIQKLGNKELKWDEKNALRELLFEYADLQRMKGAPIDAQLEKVLEKSYTRLQYSKILTDKYVNGLQTGEAEVIGELLKDEKMASAWQLIGKLASDEERLQAFSICKHRIKSACEVVDKVNNLDLSVKMFSEISSLCDRKSYSDNSSLTITGEHLAEKLFDKGNTALLIELVGSDVFDISYLRAFIHKFGADQKLILDLAKKSGNLEGIFFALKYVTQSELLPQSESDLALFAKLEEEQKDKLLEYSKDLVSALGQPADAVAMTKLNEDAEDQYARRKMAQNKFVVGIKGGRYIIAWSNVGIYKYHRDMFEAIRGMKAKSGGYVGFEKKDGKNIIRVERSSTDFGYYSQELLEKNREILLEAFKSALGEGEVELEIKPSSQF